MSQVWPTGPFCPRLPVAAAARRERRWFVAACWVGSRTSKGLNALAQYDEQAPQAAEINDYTTKEDVAYILARLNAFTTSPAMAGTTLSQMAPLPSIPSTPPLIVSGRKQEGYLYVGTHPHGAPIWGSVDTMSLSMMTTNADAATVGHAEDQ